MDSTAFSSQLSNQSHDSTTSPFLKEPILKPKQMSDDELEIKDELEINDEMEIKDELEIKDEEWSSSDADSMIEDFLGDEVQKQEPLNISNDHLIEDQNSSNEGNMIQDQEEDQHIYKQEAELEVDQENQVNDQEDSQKQQHPTKINDTRKITLRGFQRDLINNGLERNSIIYLPTGTGKTRVAICSMYYYLCKYGTKDNRKQIIFLANTIQLVKQQTEAIRITLDSIIRDQDFSKDLIRNLKDNYIPLRWTKEDLNNEVLCIHGEKNDEVGENQRKKIESAMAVKKELLKTMGKSTVIVMIAQMFLNCLRRGYVKLTDFSFIVLDECHHCAGDHPYSGIMKEFYFDTKKKWEDKESLHTDREKPPYIMGLTASPISQPVNDPEKLRSAIKQLCVNLDSNFPEYSKDESLKSETEITIENIEEKAQKQAYPDLISFFERFRDHKTSYDKISYHFPVYFKCVAEIIGMIEKKHISLHLEEDVTKITDLELFLFYDIKECLLIKIRDLWLELGQYAFCLAFHDMISQLSRVSGFKNTENTQLLTDLVFKLKQYEVIFFKLYGNCQYENMSAKLIRLIQILKPPSEGSTLGQQLQNKKKDMVLVFAFKRRTVQYLYKVFEKYRVTLDLDTQKYYESVGVTGYAGKSGIHKIKDGHSYQSDPSAIEKQTEIDKLYSEFLDEVKHSQIIINTSKGQSQNLTDEMTRMYKTKMGKLLLQVQQKYSHQISKIIRFRKGEVRVLITTSVTEQGFDIPGCNLVISFDTPFSLKSYIQIKGRARKRFSKYYIFTTNKNYQKMKENKMIYDNTINATYQIAINQIGKKEIESNHSQASGVHYEKVRTKGGALINTNYALQLLKGYFSSLRHPNKGYYHYVQTINICYKCIIKFPESSPCKYSYIVGEAFPKKNQALKSAAFKAVVALKKDGLIRDDLRPAKLEELQDQLEMEKYDDIDTYNIDSAFREVFNSSVCIKTDQEQNKKYLRLYFKSLSPLELDFDSINPAFDKQKDSFQKQKFPFQIYLLKFESKIKNNNNKIGHEDTTELGLLTCFPSDATQEVFAQYSHKFVETTKEEIHFKKITLDYQINKADYEKLKRIHLFLINAQKNNEIQYYWKITNKEPQAPNWINCTNLKKTRKKMFVIDEKRQYYPLILLLKRTNHKDKFEYNIDVTTNAQIENHIDIMKEIYEFHNKPSKTINADKFKIDLSDQYNSFVSLITNRESTTMIQCISREFCFHKGIISHTTLLDKKIEEEEEKKRKNKIKHKLTKLKQMFIHARSHEESKIEEETVVRLKLYKIFEKEQQNMFLNRSGNQSIKIDQQDKGPYRCLKQFLQYPISPQLLFKVSIVTNFVYKGVEDYCLALMFKNRFLKNLYLKKLPLMEKIPAYIFNYYGNVILENGNAVFQNLTDHGRCKYLRNIGKSYNKPNAEFKAIDFSFNISNSSFNIQKHLTQHSNFLSQSMNNSYSSDKSELLNTSNILPIAEINQIEPNIQTEIFMKNKKGHYFEAEEGAKKVEDEFVLTLKELKVPELLKTLTSKIYNHHKEYNYEEYQFIGDVVLKLLATIEIFLLRTEAEEGQMHIARANIICNANLHKKAIRNRLFQYMLTTKNQSEPPPFKMFNYNNEQDKFEKLKYKNTEIQLHNYGLEDEGYQYIPGKVHADVVEALIGVFYLTKKTIQDCQMLLYTLDVLVKPSLKISFGPTRPQNSNIPEYFKDFEKRINYPFKDKGLLLQALTHPTFRSYIEEVVDDRSISQIIINTSSNEAEKLSFLGSKFIEKKTKIIKYHTFYERLEFLGDAVLDMVVVQYIYDRESHHVLDQGTLSLLKQSAVSNKSLGLIALSLGMHELILMDFPEIEKMMRDFQFVRKDMLKYLGSPEEFAKLKLNSIKLLGDVFEGVIGALFIDNQMDYIKTKEIIMQMMGKYISLFTEMDFVKNSPSFKYKEFLDQNNYKKMKMVKDTAAGIKNGQFRYILVDKSGSLINECWESSEKNAWDKLLDTMEEQILLQKKKQERKQQQANQEDDF